MNMKLIKELRRQRLYAALLFIAGIAIIAIVPDDCTGGVMAVAFGFFGYIGIELEARKIKKAGER